MLAPIPFQLGGQEVCLNNLAKVLILHISEPFYSAGKIFSWKPEFGSPAFGINGDILRFMYDRKLKLLIRCDTEPSREYWLHYSEAVDFVNSVNCEYLVRGTKVYAIPWKIFHPKPVFSGITL